MHNLDLISLEAGIQRDVPLDSGSVAIIIENAGSSPILVQMGARSCWLPTGVKDFYPLTREVIVSGKVSLTSATLSAISDTPGSQALITLLMQDDTADGTYPRASTYPHRAQQGGNNAHS